MATDGPAEPRLQKGALSPARETHAPDGTDLTLIRWMLSLSHEERFEVLQSGARSLAQLLDARPDACFAQQDLDAVHERSPSGPAS